MLAVVAAEGARRGFANLETRAGAAEVLPFESGTFDLIVTRYSAHHWASVPNALAECARVAAPGARLIVIDLVSPETPLFDTSLQVVEFLRDASHVRDYRVSEWRVMQEAAGFRSPTITSWKLDDGLQQLDRAHRHAAGAGRGTACGVRGAAQRGEAVLPGRARFVLRYGFGVVRDNSRRLTLDLPRHPKLDSRPMAARYVTRKSQQKHRSSAVLARARSTAGA